MSGDAARRSACATSEWSGEGASIIGRVGGASRWGADGHVCARCRAHRFSELRGLSPGGRGGAVFAGLVSGCAEAGEADCSGDAEALHAAMASAAWVWRFSGRTEAYGRTNPDYFGVGGGR